MIGKAYSVEYAGQVSNTGNNVISDYFTIGLFSYNPDPDEYKNAPTGEVVPYIDDEDRDEYNANLFNTTESPFDNGRITYLPNEDGDTCEITDKKAELTDGNLYLRIIETTSKDNRYEIGCKIEELHSPEMKGQENLLTGNPILTWGGNNPEIETGNAYMLSLSLTELNYTGAIESIPTSLSITITVTELVKRNSGTEYTTGNTIVAEFSGEIDNICDELGNLNKNSNLKFEVSKDDPKGIYIQTNSANHSIADKETTQNGDSKISATVHVPENTRFCLYITMKGAWTALDTSTSSITVKVLKNGKQIGEEEISGKSYFIYNPEVKKYIYLDTNKDITSGDSQPKNKENYIVCNENDSLSISFEGEENTTNISQTMTVTVKLIPYT